MTKRGPYKSVCKRGHVRSVENLTKNGSCRLCKSARKRERLSNDPEFAERERTYQREYKRALRTPTFISWESMHQRCRWSGCAGWRNYGGRGITVCERWDSFDNFLADMGERPEGMTLDRIDVDGNYEPGNCRWATRAEQRSNQRERAKRMNVRFFCPDCGDEMPYPSAEFSHPCVGGWATVRAEDCLDPKALNEAKWAACNMRWVEPVPSMESVSEAVERAVARYLISVGLADPSHISTEKPL